jgi:hypothetical protein
MKKILALISISLILSGCCAISGVSAFSAGSLMSNTSIRLTPDGERELINKVKTEILLEKLRYSPYESGNLDVPNL